MLHWLAGGAKPLEGLAERASVMATLKTDRN